MVIGVELAVDNIGLSQGILVIILWLHFMIYFMVTFYDE